MIQDSVLRINGARQHNLKNISVELPKNKLIVFTGLSGSGKSSLAFDTIYAEGQRRYVESLSSYARQFLGIMDKPDVDSIVGLSPAISIDQKSTSHNPRSTVGTVTEIYDYLRLLFARIGNPHCPNCGREISRQSSDQIVSQIFTHAMEQLKQKHTMRLFIFSPIVRDRKGEFSGLFDNLLAKGYTQVRVDGRLYNLEDELILIKTNKHSIDVVIDRLSIEKKMLRGDKLTTFRRRLSDDVGQAVILSQGLVTVGQVEDISFEFSQKPKKIIDHIYSEKFSCPICNISIPEIEPRTFSFNSPHGACSVCSGIGTIRSVDPELVMNPNLSITEGGILPFARMFFHDTWFSRITIHVATLFGIDVRAPLAQMNNKQREILLYGTGNTVHSVTGKNRFGELTAIQDTYPGIIGELKKRHLETESEFVRLEIEKYMAIEVCHLCGGKRLKKESLTITIDNETIAEVSDLSIRDAIAWMIRLEHTFGVEARGTIGKPIVKEIIARLTFLNNVGLEYLSISRSAMTLSGGEAQRIRLASQIGSGLTGVLYVLDEPSIGLHQKDNARLIQTLKSLQNLGNTVIVVEHDRDMIESGDYVVDFGPGAGKDGGRIVAEGTVKQIKLNPHSLTGKYLNGSKVIERGGSTFWNSHTDNIYADYLTLYGAKHNNLKNIDVTIPLHALTSVTGVSGSGKSSLIVETLYPALYMHFNPYSKVKPGAYDRIDGLHLIDKVILIDQSPIGRTPRSNPATYTGVFTFIRDLFAQLPESKARGFNPGRFSFNVKGGRCEACEGEGQKKIEMQFLSDVYVTCEVCHGARYNTDTLEIFYHSKHIAQVLDMTAHEALSYFSSIPYIATKIQTLVDVGLGYIHLGQPAPTLSGGEAQRVKLATELSRRATGKTVYILDEPTTGLHFADLEKLLQVLHRLTQMGNTVIVIEHNGDIIKNSDWIIDLGPEGGDAGGEIVAMGKLLDIEHVHRSYTGQFLQLLHH